MKAIERFREYARQLRSKPGVNSGYLCMIMDTVEEIERLREEAERAREEAREERKRYEQLDVIMSILYDRRTPYGETYLTEKRFMEDLDREILLDTIYDIFPRDSYGRFFASKVRFDPVTHRVERWSINPKYYFYEVYRSSLKLRTVTLYMRQTRHFSPEVRAALVKDLQSDIDNRGDDADLSEYALMGITFGESDLSVEKIEDIIRNSETNKIKRLCNSEDLWTKDCLSQNGSDSETRY